MWAREDVDCHAHLELEDNTPAGCSKGRPAGPQAMSKPEAYPQGTLRISMSENEAGGLFQQPATFWLCRYRDAGAGHSSQA